jgi:NAD(P)-dependent dehydrogenase (short-subunit alcohol dehydrogenase family)
VSDWLGLRGRRAVVTGGGGGIGRAVSVALAEAGVSVCAVDRDPHTLEETRTVAKDLGYIVETCSCDVTDEANLRSIAQEFEPFDIVVNAAGVSRSGSILEMDLTDWSTVMTVNLQGYLHITRAFVPAMVNRGSGSLVHIASISARFPQAASTAYSASKAGVYALSQQLAVELGPSGIRSNTISPGLVRTPMTEAYYQVPGVATKRDAAVPIRRVATPDDIADVAAFLASDRSRYITGADIVVDGGFTANLMSTVPRPGYES